ncbi:hypothetical protein PIB30_081041, partial [Stylosanthes scabra]|nr:hypothetical protein [Stylosanthes scabra]
PNENPYQAHLSLSKAPFTLARHPLLSSLCCLSALSSRTTPRPSTTFHEAHPKKFYTPGKPFAIFQRLEMSLRNILDQQRRLLATKYELRRKLYKAFCKDSDLPGDMRDKLRYKLSKLPRNSSFTRVRNRCIYTGRPRSVYEFFRMSRIVFRELASQGSLMGIKKSSW